MVAVYSSIHGIVIVCSFLEKQKISESLNNSISFNIKIILFIYYSLVRLLNFENSKDFFFWLYFSKTPS